LFFALPTANPTPRFAEMRFARYNSGLNINKGYANMTFPDPRASQVLQWDRENWELIADTGFFWCPQAPGPESVTDPAKPQAKDNDGFSPVNGIVGSSIVPNGNFWTLVNFDPIAFAQAGKWPFNTKSRVDHLTRPPSETLLCGDGNDIGIRCWSEDFRSGYLGEYSDPMWRHVSSEGVRENMDQGWHAEGYGSGPAGDQIRRGNGRCNIGFADGHVSGFKEAELEQVWESKQINFALE
jgi:prepilin-type processing-associated H-X9-DG protein